jgi:hypothetical protein
MMVSVLVFQIFESLETSHFQRSRRNEGFRPEHHPFPTKSYAKPRQINLLSGTRERSGLANSTLRYPPTFCLPLADPLLESRPETSLPPAGDAAAGVEVAMRNKITKRTVEAIGPSLRDTVLWDTEIPGFGCKVTPKGARIYVLQYSQRDRDHRVTNRPTRRRIHCRTS